MKITNYFRKALVTAIFIFSVSNLFAPPSPPGQGQSGDQPAGGGAPLGEGIVFLLIAGASYAGKKTWNALLKNKEEENH